MKIRPVKFKTMYFSDNEYNIRIEWTESENFGEAWLSKDGYGIESYMFGCNTENLKEFLLIVEANLEEYEFYYEEDGYGI